ncbi:hypothetical protein CLG94_02545 [Candidatus Methylomirabilis limnetica]|jgi:hypothetical protein|uniref:Uncharacterized protein n=1 Tax=Candidatus Methylomirabilis limnetica TaxID=2033718 RepID=A0A2T4U083_9BACT|nr:hypothetical protein [Candidatus Methylomirabilis limnetica]PTL36777.1 hypothetical protein CLG94_02545 [Candidatus Methylomirabilis limnetica]
MVYHILCEVDPKREEELDNFLRDKMKKFWLAQPGVSRFHIFGDHLAASVERIITIEIGNFGNLDKILVLDERKALRSELMQIATNVTSRVLEIIE